MPAFVLVSFLDANYTYEGSISEFLYLLIPSPESLMLPPMNLTHTHTACNTSQHYATDRVGEVRVTQVQGQLLL